MTLLNKTIAQGFDFPWAVLLVQNVGTVLIGYIYPMCCGQNTGKQETQGAPGVDKDCSVKKGRKVFGMRVPSKRKNQNWVCGQVLLFMSQLFVSLKALKHISVPLYVVARNTVPAQTALVERLLTKASLSAVSCVGLAFTILGAAIYTYGDIHGGLDPTGMIFVILVTANVSVCSVVDKMAVKVLSQEEDMRPVECNQLRVALSLPLNAMFVLLFELGDVPPPDDLIDAPQVFGQTLLNAGTSNGVFSAALQMSLAVFMALLLSTIFGFGMGTFNFYLQQAVSATTVQVANILYKLCTTIVSRATHPDPVTLTSWIGYSVSLAGIAIYTFGPKLLRRHAHLDHQIQQLWKTEDRPKREEAASCAGEEKQQSIAAP